ncbi:MAG TPA: metal ABC transporter substrate-binding protein [Patescibacteria group bacterium]|nr:metal ABC transporter substrate-binding protein [Patescibacteria group bacterium]
MRNTVAIFRLTLVMGGLMALCQSTFAKLNVVATTPDFASIASAIGGNEVAITTLAKPTEDPHFVDAKPSFIMKLNRADALIEGGADLEIGWLPALLDQARNSKLAQGAPGRIACNQNVQLLEVPASLDRSKGDIHAAGNPHYLTDPANARIVADHIAQAFSQLDPKSAGIYSDNLKKFTAQLDGKLKQWEGLLTPFKNQEVVAYHDSWPYFAHRFSLNISLFLEPKPGIPPTPVHLAEVILKMRSDHIHAILVEPYQNRKTAQTVGADTGATVVEVSQFPGGVKGTENGYIELMDYNIHALARALAGSKQAHMAGQTGSVIR